MARHGSRLTLAEPKGGAVLKRARAQVRASHPCVASCGIMIEFRKEAEEARRQAERAISSLDKEEWLRVAAEWIKLAQDAEKRRAQD